MYNLLLKIVLPIAKILFGLRCEGKIDLPDGPVVVIANHKNNLDPVMVSLCVNRQVHWMAKKELYNNKILAWFFYKLGAFPVDREKNDIRSMRKAMEILKDNRVLGMFPEGTRKKVIDYNSAKSGAAMLASRMNAKIVPIYIDGDYKLFKPLVLKYRNIIELDAKKRTEEEYKLEIKKIMKTIYEGDNQIGNYS